MNTSDTVSLSQELSAMIGPELQTVTLPSGFGVMT
jgi:hypothetical protein